MTGNNWDHFYDDEYEYQWLGEQLNIYEKETGNCLYVLVYPTDKWYVNGNNAYLEDGIFYGAGGWSTEMTIAEDGTFDGVYCDSEQEQKWKVEACMAWL